VYIRFLKVQPVNKWNQKRKIMRRYDLTAQMYDARYAEEQAVKYQAALKHLNVTRYSTILDVGCGTGLLFSHIAAEAETVAAVDISRLLLRQAREHARVFRNVHLVQADANHLPFRDAYFSMVFAFTVLQNMPKPMETLSEVKRNTKQGASIVVTGLKKAFSLEAFSALLQNAGLQVVYLEDADVLKCYVAVTVRN
jgi:ubiquinone/menaquinone biosynthesis C-methylase UbiE